MFEPRHYENKKQDEKQTVSNPLEHVVMLQALQALKDMTQVQCSDGTWNYDPYMQGMANGMIFALSIFEGGEPKYLDAPDAWLKDIDLPPIPTETEAT